MSLKEQLKLQLDAIPSLNEYFNRLPSKTKEWIISGAIQAVKDWLEQKKNSLPDGLSEEHEIMACCIYNQLIDELPVVEKPIQEKKP